MADTGRFSGAQLDVDAAGYQSRDRIVTVAPGTEGNTVTSQRGTITSVDVDTYQRRCTMSTWLGSGIPRMSSRTPCVTPSPTAGAIEQRGSQLTPGASSFAREIVRNSLCGPPRVYRNITLKPFVEPSTAAPTS